MTSTLKKQLGALVLGTICLGAAPFLQARERGAATPEAAAKNFSALLEASARLESPQWDLRFGTLARSPLDQASETLLLADLGEQAWQSRFEVRGRKKEGDKIVVQVAPLDRTAPLPVVVIEKNGRFQVDLIATYGKRKNLSDKGPLQTAIFQKTLVALPGLPDTDKPETRTKICQGQLRQLSYALMGYVQDYDERFPPASDWKGRLRPYTRTEAIFHCPDAPGGKHGYAYNTRLAERGEPDLYSVPDYFNRVAFYETNNLIPSASGTGDDQAFRHLQSGKSAQNVALLNGEITLVRPGTKLLFDFPAKAGG